MPKTPPSRSWPTLIVALGLLFLIFSGWSAYQASTRGSAVTDRDYYSHGLKYDHALVEQKAAETLGWTAAIDVSDGWFRCRLGDRSGMPVTGGAGEVVLFRVRTGTETRLLLHEVEPGVYGAPLPVGLQGELPAELTLARDGARITRRLQLNF